jgi:hypothetical protein
MLWQLWSGTKLKADLVAQSDYLLSDQEMASIQLSLTSSVPRIPTELGTIPKAMTDSGFFKAAQWKAFLSVFGPSLLYEYLPDDAHQNLCDLQAIWIIATMRSITPASMAQLKILVLRFVRSYEAIYYRRDIARLPACTVNIY